MKKEKPLLNKGEFMDLLKKFLKDYEGPLTRIAKTNPKLALKLALAKDDGGLDEEDLEKWS